MAMDQLRGLKRRSDRSMNRATTVDHVQECFVNSKFCDCALNVTFDYEEAPSEEEEKDKELRNGGASAEAPQVDDPMAIVEGTTTGGLSSSSTTRTPRSSSKRTVQILGHRVVLSRAEFFDRLFSWPTTTSTQQQAVAGASSSSSSSSSTSSPSPSPSRNGSSSSFYPPTPPSVLYTYAVQFPSDELTLRLCIDHLYGKTVDFHELVSLFSPTKGGALASRDGVAMTDADTEDLSEDSEEDQDEERAVEVWETRLDSLLRGAFYLMMDELFVSRLLCTLLREATSCKRSPRFRTAMSLAILRAALSIDAISAKRKLALWSFLADENEIPAAELDSLKPLLPTLPPPSSNSNSSANNAGPSSSPTHSSTTASNDSPPLPSAAGTYPYTYPPVFSRTRVQVDPATGMTIIHLGRGLRRKFSPLPKNNSSAAASSNSTSAAAGNDTPSHSRMQISSPSHPQRFPHHHHYHSHLPTQQPQPDAEDLHRFEGIAHAPSTCSAPSNDDDQGAVEIEVENIRFRVEAGRDLLVDGESLRSVWLTSTPVPPLKDSDLPPRIGHLRLWILTGIHLPEEVLRIERKYDRMVMKTFKFPCEHGSWSHARTQYGAVLGDVHYYSRHTRFMFEVILPPLPAATPAAAAAPVPTPLLPPLPTPAPAAGGDEDGISEEEG